MTAHFCGVRCRRRRSREALLDAVKAWSSEQIAKALRPDAPQHERINYVSRFVLENPELIKLWIEEFVSVGDIHDSYPYWDALVEGIKHSITDLEPDETIDAEVYCVILLTSAIIGPRVFKNRVGRNEDAESVVHRFRKERRRLLKHGALFRP